MILNLKFFTIYKRCFNVRGLLSTQKKHIYTYIFANRKEKWIDGIEMSSFSKRTMAIVQDFLDTVGFNKLFFYYLYGNSIEMFCFIFKWWTLFRIHNSILYIH